MKTGLITSVTLHAVLIGFGLFSLSSPRAYEAADVEALSVDTISVEEFTRLQQGEKDAPAEETPAPRPTSRPDSVEDATNVGDNDVDLDTPPTTEPKPRPVETASAPSASEPTPVPAEEPEPAPRSEPEAEPVPVPATEVTPEPQPRQDVEPDPVPEPEVAENPESESVKLPDTAPVPELRPQPPRAQTAKAPERKNAEEPAREQASAPQPEERNFDEDKIAALLNKEEPSGGGAKRSQQQAALGGETTTAEKLSQGEMEALRNQLSGCWNIPVGAENVEGLTASVEFSVNRSGRVEGLPSVVNSSGHRQFDESAVRAIQKCDQRGLALPQGKEEIWARIVVNFDPSEMF